jgi:hypothetical protein
VLFIFLKISTSIASIKDIMTLNSYNYKEWRDQLKIILGLVDLDVTLQKDKLTKLTIKSIEDVKIDVPWIGPNCVCLKVMQKIISETFRGIISETTMAKEF